MPLCDLVRLSIQTMSVVDDKNDSDVEKSPGALGHSEGVSFDADAESYCTMMESKYVYPYSLNVDDMLNNLQACQTH